MTTDITILDYIVFIAFLVGIVLFGSSFISGIKEAIYRPFTVAGGNLPSWVVGMSIFATFVSGISFLGYPGEAYTNNWNPLFSACPFHRHLVGCQTVCAALSV